MSLVTSKIHQSLRPRLTPPNRIAGHQAPLFPQRSRTPSARRQYLHQCEHRNSIQFQFNRSSPVGRLPIRTMHSIRAHCLKLGHSGYGKHFCQPGGSHDGLLSSPRHRMQNAKIHDCSNELLLLGVDCTDCWFKYCRAFRFKSANEPEAE